MAGRLEREIGLSRPIDNLEEEAFLNLQRTAHHLLQHIVRVLEPSGLDPAQYNTLRILRGTEGGSLPCSEVTERMVTRGPDVPRVFDDLVERGLIERRPEVDGGAEVTIEITEAGLDLLEDLDGPILKALTGMLGHLGGARLRSLIGLLEEARGGLA